MRIAYISTSNTMYIYGGEATAVYHLACMCDEIGWILDIYTNESCLQREQYMDPTYIPRLGESEGDFHSTLRPIQLGLAAAERLENSFSSVYNFLQSLSTKIPDIAIFENPFCAFTCLAYGLHKYIPCFIYTHLTELVYDVPSVIPSAVIEGYRNLCAVPGLSLLTQCSTNKNRLQAQFPSTPIFIVPLSEKVKVQGYGDSGIVYMGGGDRVKDPHLASAVLCAFHDRHPDVPILAIGARGNRVMEDLFGSFAQVLYKLNACELHKVLATARLGIHTAHDESFGLAVLEQLMHYPVVLRQAGYTKNFPMCPTFNGVSDGIDALENLYYDEVVYQTTREAALSYLNLCYSYANTASGLQTAYSQSKEVHRVRQSTIDSVSSALTSGPLPLQVLFGELSWNSAVVGIKSILGCCDVGLCKLHHTQMLTYVGLMGQSFDTTQETSVASVGAQFLF